MIPKKSLGQNFLTDDSVAKRIVDSANLSPRDNVLEIGPGKGILTKYLAEYARWVLAVEIDRELVANLRPVIARSEATKQSRAILEKTGLLRFARNDKIKIIEGDILKINLPKLIEENNFQDYKVIANLPYYITSKIIRLLLETKYPPSEMVLMVQKEVGERICAPDAKPRSGTQRVPATGGKESILSISVKFYAKPEILFYVSKEKFNPVPEVDSVVVKIKRKESVPDVDVKKFFSLVRAGFSSKRKMLVNNLSNGFHIPKEKTAEIIKKAGIKPTQRAQELTLEDWLLLHKEIFSLITGQKTR